MRNREDEAAVLYIRRSSTYWLFTLEVSVWPSVCQSVRPSVRPSVCMSVRPSVCLSVCLSICPSVCMSVRLSVCPSVRLSACPSVCLSVRPSLCPSVCLSVCLPVRLSVRPSVRLSVCLSHSFLRHCLFICCVSLNVMNVDWRLVVSLALTLISSIVNFRHAPLNLQIGRFFLMQVLRHSCPSDRWITGGGF